MTIKDIAKESGYAVATVSRALNGRPNVSPRAMAKISKIIQNRGFTPNDNARRLKVAKGESVLVLVKGAFNLFFAEIIERIQSQFELAFIPAEVHYIDENDDEIAFAARLMRERKPLGFLFLGGNVEEFKKSFEQILVPSVLATTVAADFKNSRLCCIGIDDSSAGAKACRFLLQRGHKYIAVIGGNRKSSYISALRYNGFCAEYCKEFEKHGEDYYYNSSFNMESAYKAMTQILQDKKPTTAVFCMSDLIAIGAMRAVHDMGLKVPQDISVLGFDGLTLGRFSVPTLASVAQPYKQIADSSVSLLIAMIKKKQPPPITILPIKLIDGESVLRL